MGHLLSLMSSASFYSIMASFAWLHYGDEWKSALAIPTNHRLCATRPVSSVWAAGRGGTRPMHAGRWRLISLDLTWTGLMGIILQFIGAKKSQDLIGHIRGLHYGIKPHPFDYRSTSVSGPLVLMTTITGAAVTVIAMNICIPTICWENGVFQLMLLCAQYSMCA